LEFGLAVLATALIVFLIECKWGREDFRDALDQNRQALYSTSASLAGSLLGFAIAAVSIILAVGQMPRFRLLRESAQRDTVFRVYFQAILWLAVTTVWALAALVADTDATPRPVFAYGLIGLALISALRLSRCVWVLRVVTTILVR
jgi:hypothetical protein